MAGIGGTESARRSNKLPSDHDDPPHGTSLRTIGGHPRTREHRLVLSSQQAAAVEGASAGMAVIMTMVWPLKEKHSDKIAAVSCES